VVLEPPSQDPGLASQGPGLDADVLIIGGGPAGLLAAMELDSKGIASLVIEERAFLEPQGVKSNHISARTMERFRRLGIADVVRNAGLPHDHPHDVAFRTTVTGIELGRVVLPSRDGRAAHASGADSDWPTPEPPHRINQRFLEPILERHARDLPHVTVLNQTRFLDLEQFDDYVLARVCDVDGANERLLRARYLIGADGGRSLVRRKIGASLQGDPVLQNVQSTCIRAPKLHDLMKAERAWGYYTYNPRRNGHMYEIDGRGIYLIHNHLKPDEVESGAVHRLAAIRSILGVDEDFEFEVLSEEDWVARRLVADRLRDRRVFIVGDAAHLWVPYAGYGMNAGIADALNLAWLLAARLNGWSGEGILDAYEAERLPITEQVSKFAMSHQRKISDEMIPDDIEDDSPGGEAAREQLAAYAYELNVQQFAAAGLNFGYVYDQSPIIEYDGSVAPAYTMGSFTASTVPGCRAPHVWMPDGTSLYDHFSHGYTVLCLGDPAEFDEFATEARALGVPLAIVDLRSLPEAETAAYDCRYVIAREDQHIAFRGDTAPADSRGLLEKLAGLRAARSAQQNELAAYEAN
jgi:2-polyprenyl-6-methoxyphenol hydroxylase-like FAD-dependent oxidoreductase